MEIPSSVKKVALVSSISAKVQPEVEVELDSFLFDFRDFELIPAMGAAAGSAPGPAVVFIVECR